MQDLYCNEAINTRAIDPVIRCSTNNKKRLDATHGGSRMHTAQCQYAMTIRRHHLVSLGFEA
jgi:hypothetical protein